MSESGQIRGNLTGKADGNPEPSPKGKVQRLDGQPLAGNAEGEEKVQTTNSFG